MPDLQDAPRRRQGRGLRRIESILDAAERVISDAGYENATTNQIAAAAGISPGSLYQYFANKSEIVEALARRYLALYAAVHDADRGSVTNGGQTHELVDQLVDSLVEFNLAHPAVRFLLAGADLSPDLSASTSALHAVLRDQVGTLLSALAPARSTRERTLTATLSIQIVAGSLPSILAATPRDRALLLKELKTALGGYWSAVAG